MLFDFWKTLNIDSFRGSDTQWTVIHVLLSHLRMATTKAVGITASHGGPFVFINAFQLCHHGDHLSSLPVGLHSQVP